MLQSCPRSTLEVSQTPAGCLAPGDPLIYCLRQRRQSPDLSAAPVIPTRIKNVSITAIWTSSGSTLLSKTYFDEQATVKYFQASSRICQGCTSLDLHNIFPLFARIKTGNYVHFKSIIWDSCTLTDTLFQVTPCNYFPEAPDTVMVQVMASPRVTNPS